MKIKKNFRIKELIFQIIPVMIGVFLGFVISNWTENSKIEAKTKLFKKNIIAEINLNKNNLERVINYHTILRDSSRFYSKKENLKTTTEFFKGIRTPSLTNSAFESGLQTGLINELSFNQIQLVNSTYTLQRNYNEFNTLILEGLISIDFDETEENQKKIFRFLSITMTDVVIKESQLLKIYDSLLTILNK